MGSYLTWVRAGNGCYRTGSAYDNARIPDVSRYLFMGAIPVLERLEICASAPDGAGKIAAFAPEPAPSVSSGKLSPAVECYPNPFNASTTIQFTLPADSRTRLTIYSITGQKVRDLLDENRGTGTHAVVWNGKDDRGLVVSSGIYFARLRAGETVLTRRMMFMK
jgi:hypothetical protein